MRRYVIFVSVIILFFGSFTIGFSQLSQSEKDAIQNSIEIKVVENADNIKKPKFEWKEVADVENYQLYVKNELIYSGKKPFFPPDDTYPYEEFAYGYYQTYLTVQLKDGTRIRSNTFEFVIGIHKPELLTLKDKEVSYKMEPVFKWTTVKGATNYEVYLDMDVIYDGPSDSYTPTERIAFGNHTWTVVAKNEFQQVRSDRGMFQIIRIQPPTLNAPEDGYSVTVITETDIPKLVWNKVEPRAPGEISYILEVNGQQVYEGKDLNWETPGMLQPGLYRWHVRAKVYDQESDNSETWSFTLKEKIGMNIGVKVGPNLVRTVNPISKIRPMFTAGAYVDQRLAKKNAFELRAELNIFAEMRNVGFKQEENYEKLVKDLSIQTLNLTFPLMIKPQYRIGQLVIYGSAGAQFSYFLVRHIVRKDGYTENIIGGQLEPFGVDLVLGVGALYVFKNVNYLFDQKLTLSAEFRFNYGFINHLNKSFLGIQDNLTQYTFLIGNKIIDF